MDKLTQVQGVAAVLPHANIDTDQIIPKQFLTTVERTGLGKGLLHEMRYDAKGEEIPSFVLNQEPYRNARILIAGENFGCGSSREHAVWALQDFGIRCVIAPSYASIFHNNALKNGMLLIALPQEDIDRIIAALQKSNSSEMSVDLAAQRIVLPDTRTVPFPIDEGIRERLLEGIDDIEATLRQSAEIKDYVRQSQQALPWLWRQNDSVTHSNSKHEEGENGTA
jgi:3-isopropylmalate/(R)-2-methylmalate dehydratase small subunit